MVVLLKYLFLRCALWVDVTKQHLFCWNITCLKKVHMAKRTGSNSQTKTSVVRVLLIGTNHWIYYLLYFKVLFLRSLFFILDSSGAAFHDYLFKNLYRSPENSICSPLFTAFHKILGSAKTQSDTWWLPIYHVALLFTFLSFHSWFVAADVFLIKFNFVHFLWLQN